MASLAPNRTVLQDFSQGMFPGVAPELIPSSGVYDIANGLLDEDGVQYKRGGMRTVGHATVPADCWFVWEGLTKAGVQRLFGDESGLHLLHDDGSVTGFGGVALDEAVRVAVLDGVLYFPGGQTYDGTAIGTAPQVGTFYAAVMNRLLVADGDKVWLSDIVAVAGTTPNFPADQYHLIADGVSITGLQGLRDAAVVFTTQGVWVISNLGFNLTDDAGNAQQRLDRYSRDLVLLGDQGIAGWEGGLLVPAQDGVWLMQLGIVSEAPQPFTRVSRPLGSWYRAKVAAGARPGAAVVYRGHYLLPLLVGADVTDVLVCHLEATDRQGNRTFAWTRLDGARLPRALANAYADPDLLLAAAGVGVHRADWFSPSAVSPADEVWFNGPSSLQVSDDPVEWSMVTRDLQTGALNNNTVLFMRATYELMAAGDSTPVIHAYYGSDRERGTEWGLFDWGEADWTPATGVFVALDGDAPVDPYATSPFRWRVSKKTRLARFKLVQSEATARMSLRAVEVFVRPGGRI